MTRPLVIDMSERSGRPRPERSWWQQCSDDEFIEEVEAMTGSELETLVVDLNASKASMASVAQDKERDSAWRGRAQKALVLTAKKHAVVVKIMKARATDVYLNQTAERDRIVTEVRAMALGGDIQGGLLRLLDWVSSFGAARHGVLSAARTDGRAGRETTSASTAKGEP